ncbi:MAG: hypothetical protein QOE68_1367 [Thermoanaerobaculia bacterium]|jgi:hypothetical protein|nr:hypothetical protein [Thermoanaerobaculia bacterium]
MKADVTRFTYDPAKRFAKVLAQQGRAQLDADSNEQVEIQAHREELTAIDVIGQTGFPKGDGFRVEALSSGTIQVHPGRAYVDGILCELPGENAVEYSEQPDLIDAPAIDPVDGRRDLVYLDVWERHLTAHQEPSIQEVALGGADTATRTRMLCQIRVETGIADSLTCDSVWTKPGIGGGRLTTLLDASGTAADLCSPLPSSAFRGLENRLYRIEIHTAGDLNTAEFKWSRDNGSIVFSIEDGGFEGTDAVKLVRLGRDPMLSLAPEQWAEVIGDTSELATGAGTFAQIDSVTSSTRLVKFKSAVNAHSAESHPIVRRWDGPLQTVDGTAVELEDGIKIQFSGSEFQVGDYWTFTARTTGEGGLEILDHAEAHGIRHHYARLGIVKWTKVAENNWTGVVDDCRKKQWFPPLTEITAEDVSFNPDVCKFNPEIDTVQKAIDELCKREHEGCELVAEPGVGWEKVFRDIKAGVDATICFKKGDYPVTTSAPIRVTARHLKLTGAGWGTRILAQKGKCAVRFENCTSVIVRDLQAQALVATPKDNAKSLNGVLTFQGCRNVSLSGLNVECAPAAVRAVSCITVNNKPAGNDADRGLVEVRDCHFRIGDQQVGLLVVNAQRVFVRDNRMRVVPPPAKFFDIKMQNLAARSAVMSAMVSGVTLVDKEAEAKRTADKTKKEPATPPRRAGDPAVAVVPQKINPLPLPRTGVRVEALTRAINVKLPVTDKLELRFNTDAKLAAAWKSVLKPAAMTTDVKKISDHIRKLADRFVTDQKTAPLDIKQWLAAVAKTTCASQGITIAGTEVLEVIVEDNTILGVAQAIHIAVSHENPVRTGAQVDRMERVTVTGNDIHVYAAVGYTRSRHAIFVGNANSIVIRENYGKLTRFTGMLEQPIEGIRVFGYFGRYISVRENHLAAVHLNVQDPVSHFTVGVLFQLRGTAPAGKPLWQIRDNLAEKSSTTVSWNSALMFVDGNLA